MLCGRRSLYCSGRRSLRRPTRTCWRAADASRSTSLTPLRNAAGVWRFGTTMVRSDEGRERGDQPRVFRANPLGLD